MGAKETKTPEEIFISETFSAFRLAVAAVNESDELSEAGNDSSLSSILAGKLVS